MSAKHSSASSSSHSVQSRGVGSRRADRTTTDVRQPTSSDNARYVRQYRLLNRWSIFLLLVMSSLIIILFVSNTLAINKLFEEVNVLKQEHRRLVQQNEVLQAKTVRLQSPERITEIAREKLGMTHPTTAPEILQ